MQKPRAVFTKTEFSLKHFSVDGTYQSRFQSCQEFIELDLSIENFTIQIKMRATRKFQNVMVLINSMRLKLKCLVQRLQKQCQLASATKNILSSTFTHSGALGNKNVILLPYQILQARSLQFKAKNQYILYWEVKKQAQLVQKRQGGINFFCQKNRFEKLRKKGTFLFINIKSMPNNQRKFCAEHQFCLYPLRSDTHMKEKTSVWYCRGKIKSKKNKKQASQQNCCCWPTFNFDRNYATCSFILPEEKFDYLENFDRLRQEYDYRGVELSLELTEILVPKPNDAQDYCHVCKTNYSDYLEHTRKKAHRNRISRSKAAGYIMDLYRKYNNTDPKTKLLLPKIVDNAEKCNSNQLGTEPSCTQDLGNPRKRVKLSQQSHNEINNLPNPKSVSGVPTPQHPKYPQYYLTRMGGLRCPRLPRMPAPMASGMGILHCPPSAWANRYNYRWLGYTYFGWAGLPACQERVARLPVVIDLIEDSD